MMIYENIRPAKFIDRPNRFIANIEIGTEKQVCHVKNTGRCRELLVPGADIFVQESAAATRKTKYNLISIIKGQRLINIDSQAPNRVFYEWAADGNFLNGITEIRPECRFLNSRFDFYIEYRRKKAFVEVKGVTLEEAGVVMFPDAPTERGVKHLKELIACRKNGYEAFVVFVVQMSGVKYFKPNEKTHEAFAEALRAAHASGVNIVAFDCNVTKNTMTIGKPVEIKL